MTATRNFQTQLGAGGSGSVFRGTLESSATQIAVKKLEFAGAKSHTPPPPPAHTHTKRKRTVASKFELRRDRVYGFILCGQCLHHSDWEARAHTQTHNGTLARTRPHAHAHIYTGESMLRLFNTEVKALSKANHPNIVPLLGWSDDGDAPCLVYVLMEGGSLEDRLARRGNAVALTSEQRMNVISDVGRGLSYLHDVVKTWHLDVKSANVLIDAGCTGRIGDFGIARAARDHCGATATHLQTGVPMGTTIYMSPECKNGELSYKVDSFAFGLVIIEVLTGLPVLNPAAGRSNLHTMFEEDMDTLENLQKHLDTRACWEAHMSERVSALYSIAERCLEPRPKRRSEVVHLIPDLEKVRCGTGANDDGQGVAQERECNVCMVKEKSHFLVPCGHRCVCDVCAETLKTCPLCRADVLSAIRGFV